jgi:hypothetical protein
MFLLDGIVGVVTVDVFDIRLRVELQTIPSDHALA